MLFKIQSDLLVVLMKTIQNNAQRQVVCVSQASMQTLRLGFIYLDYGFITKLTFYVS